MRVLIVALALFLARAQDPASPESDLRPITLHIAWVSQDKRSPFRLADGSDAFDLMIDAGP